MMNSGNELSEQSVRLRKRAEEQAAMSPEKIAAMPPEETQRMFHELLVHQIELKMQNEELRRIDFERSRYLDLYNLAPMGYCTVSEKGLILEANLTAATLLGVPLGALDKQPFSRFILKEDQGIYYLHYKQLFETGEPQICELRMMKKDGTAFWGQLATSAIQNAGGVCVCHVVLSDVTERKQAKEALLALSVRQEAILASIPEIIMEVDCNKVYTWANQSGIEFFGDDVVGKDAAFFFEGEQETYGKIQPLFSGDEHVVYVESWQRRKDGEKRLLAWWCRMFKDARGNVQGAISTARDITERKQAEAALQSKTALLEAQMNSSIDGILVIDENNKRILVNQRFIALLNVPPQILCDEDDAALLKYALSLTRYPDQFLEKVMYLNDHVNETSRDEIEFKNGMILDRYSAPVLGRDGKYYGRIWTFRDITEHKLAETYREMGSEVLQILIGPEDWQGSIQRVLAILKTRTGLDTAGIRLKTGDDFPYFAQQGFLDDFLLKENSLVERSEGGGVCLNKDGSICLKCICGQVISGKADPANPFFTPGGSFWTNDSFPMLDIPADQDTRQHPRNQCIHHGYASVALVPIRTRDMIVGLIQLNDRRKGCFTMEMVEIIEGIASHIGEALMRKQADETLRQSEARHSKMVANIGDVIAIIDQDGINRYKSPNIEKWFGWRPEDLVGQSAWGNVHPDDLPAAKKFMISLLSEPGVAGTTECRYRCKDGAYRWIEFAGVNLLQDPDIRGILGNYHDINDRKQTEEALIVSETRYRRLFESAKDGILILNADTGKIIDVNPFLIEMLGYSKEQFIEKAIWEIGFFKDIVENQDKFLELQRNEYVRYEDLPLETADGRKINVEFVSNVYPVNHHKVIQCNIRDITIRNPAEKELIKAKEKAEESDRLKSAFLANMSHEIRTPMNGILGFTELLKEPHLSGEEQQAYIRIIEQSGDRMLNTINDIINISQIESGQMDVFISETNVNEQIEYIYNFFKLAAEQKGIRISFENTLPAEESVIKTDPGKIYGILMNLVKNAIKFTSAGSIEFGYEKKGRELEFFVKDTGIGIPKDKQSTIFDRFVQVDILNANAFQGSGLGLSIAKAYVEMLGGKIWVESEEGKGSVFYFTIPYNAEPEAKSVIENVVPADGNENPVKSLKILIAEDDENSEKLIEITVKNIGREVLKAGTGVEAVVACRNNPDIDLILMDIAMPEMNGYEATRQIRKFNKDVIIIAQTAYALDGEREKIIEAGCNDYIAKPFKQVALMTLLKKYL
ncbi:MAG: PAS domain S-box protein [Victivallaceae bacterium]